MAEIGWSAPQHTDGLLLIRSVRGKSGMIVAMHLVTREFAAIFILKLRGVVIG